MAPLIPVGHSPQADRENHYGSLVDSHPTFHAVWDNMHGVPRVRPTSRE